MDEFGLIRKYFLPLGTAGARATESADVVLGIGDDCALLGASAQELAITTDTQVEGRHFRFDAPAYDIGWKSLAVSLSDLAAMGAEPVAFLLSITLPEADDAWLTEFAAGLADVAAGAIPLIGGNTTRGPLSVTTTAIGRVPPGAALRRDGAALGDVIAVTGSLGDAALALQLRASTAAGTPRDPLAEKFLGSRLDRPSPRIAAGLALRGVAHAAIDLSDGLAGDLGHILTASGFGAEIDVARLPQSASFEALARPEDRLALQVAGGDDYELCVCLPESAVESLKIQPRLTVIGRVTAEPGVRWLDSGGRRIDADLRPYRHF